MRVARKLSLCLGMFFCMGILMAGYADSTLITPTPVPIKPKPIIPSGTIIQNTEKPIPQMIQTPAVGGPENLTAESTEIGKIVLKWLDKSNNESGFAIERKSSADDTYFEIDHVGPNITVYEQTELSQYAIFPGEDYFYRVKAYNSNGSSSYSNEIYVKVMANLASPNAPVALRAKGMMSGGKLVVRLFWADKAVNEDKYTVQRAKAGGGFVTIGELPKDSFRFEDASELERKVKYTYRVIAYNSGGAGVSNTADVILPAGPPATPAFTYIKSQGSTFILLTWADNSDNEDGFKITRWGDNSYNPFTGVKPPDKEYILNPNMTSLMITGLTPTRGYGFEIVAYNAAGKSNASYVSGATGASAPTSLTAAMKASKQTKLTWSWSGYGTVDGFSIERKKAGGTYTVVGTTEADAHSYIDGTVLSGAAYFYRVRGWTQGYDGTRYWTNYSNEKRIAVP